MLVCWCFGVAPETRLDIITLRLVYDFVFLDKLLVLTLSRLAVDDFVADAPEVS